VLLDYHNIVADKWQCVVQLIISLVFDVGIAANGLCTSIHIGIVHHCHSHANHIAYTNVLAKGHCLIGMIK